MRFYVLLSFSFLLTVSCGQQHGSKQSSLERLDQSKFPAKLTLWGDSHLQPDNVDGLTNSSITIDGTSVEFVGSNDIKLTILDNNKTNLISNLEFGEGKYHVEIDCHKQDYGYSCGDHWLSAELKIFSNH